MQKIKVKDQVIVITGKDKGKRGEVTKLLGDRVVVSGINLVKKHTKPNPQANIQGGIVEKAAPLQVSNVAIFNPATSKADRVGIKTLEDGNLVRVFKSNGELIDKK
jgi:large subunit ribosomal protein L24